jgi:fucose permease
MMFLNGLLNNIVLPLESKLSNIYSVNSKVVNLANILSFLSFLVVNLPANHIMDRRGIRFGFIVGNLLYLIGISICCLINHGFPFLIIGNMFFAMGQPFITNIPAKIATYWFFPENVKK